MTQVLNATMTWVRTRALPTGLLSLNGPLALGRPSSYSAHYNAGDESAAWRRPWIGETSFSHFWRLSFGPHYPQAAAGSAWSRMVPLREAQPPTLTTTTGGVTLTADRYAYPTGIGVAVRADLEGTFGPSELVGLASRLSSSPLVAVGTDTPKAMAAVLGQLLDDAERAILGASDESAVEESRPTMIITLTQTEQWPVDGLVQADERHRLLDALVRMSATPLTGTVGKLEDGLLDAANNYLGTVRYVVGARQVTWSADESQNSDTGLHRLSCYHANQTLAALECGVLLATVDWTRKQPIAGMSTDTREVVRRAVVLLSLLYGKVPEIYATGLSRRLITESDLKQTISDLRVQLGIGPPLA